MAAGLRPDPLGELTVLPQAQTQLDLRGGPEEDRKKGREGIKGTGRKGKIEVRVGKEDYREDEKGEKIESFAPQQFSKSAPI